MKNGSASRFHLPEGSSLFSDFLIQRLYQGSHLHPKISIDKKYQIRINFDDKKIGNNNFEVLSDILELYRKPKQWSNYSSHIFTSHYIGDPDFGTLGHMTQGLADENGLSPAEEFLRRRIQRNERRIYRVLGVRDPEGKFWRDLGVSFCSSLLVEATPFRCQQGRRPSYSLNFHREMVIYQQNFPRRASLPSPHAPSSVWLRVEVKSY